MSLAPNSIYLFRKSVPARFAPTGTPLAISVLLHSSFALLLFNLPQVFSARADLRATAAAPRKIYYFVPVLDASKTLPHILKAPVRQVPDPQTAQRPVRNNFDVQGNLAIISRPRRPDNRHQTILQPVTPDIRIATDLPLPNVIMQRKQGESPEIPVDVANAKPIEHQARFIDEAVPSITPVASPTPESSLSKVKPANVAAPAISVAKPVPTRTRTENVALPNIAAPNMQSVPVPNAPAEVRLPVLSVSVAKPVPMQRSSIAPSNAPTIQSTPASNLPSPITSGSQPQLPFPSFSAAKPAPITRTAGVPTRVPQPTDPSELVIVGVNPSPAVSQITLPPGMRVGDFTIAPPSQIATPNQTGESNSAKNDIDPRSDKKSVTGTSSSEKPSADTLVVGDLAGSKTETSGALGPALPPDIVVPVHWESPLRKHRMIVATGSIGGGGLGVYGVLNCPKIYTVFLPMPGKNWTMQYCATEPQSKTVLSTSSSLAIQWGDAILPPEPESKFDFHRSPIPADKRDKMIVLKGVLKPNGTVAELQVYRGITPEVNEAARLAFSEWKFKPAISHGVPVLVQLLIGIPATTN